MDIFVAGGKITSEQYAELENVITATV